MADLDEVLEPALRRNEKFAEAKREIDAITVTHRSPDGAVAATIRASGALIELTCTELVRGMPPRQIAAVVTQCVQAAQAELPRRIEAILRSAVPGDPLTDELVAQADRAFAPPPPAPAPTRHMPIGEIEDAGPRPQHRRRPPRPTSAYDDPDDWGGRSVMSGPGRP